MATPNHPQVGGKRVRVSSPAVDEADIDITGPNTNPRRPAYSKVKVYEISQIPNVSLVWEEVPNAKLAPEKLALLNAIMAQPELYFRKDSPEYFAYMKLLVAFKDMTVAMSPRNNNT